MSRTAGSFSDRIVAPRARTSADAEPGSASDEGAGNGRLADVLARSSELDAAAEASSDAKALMARAMDGSQFLARVIERHPETFARIFTGAPEEVLEAFLADAEAALSGLTEFTKAEAALRIARTRASALIALADLGGVWTVDDVCTALSDTADRLVAAAVRFLLAQAARANRFLPPDPAQPEKGSGYVVLAMGKLGASELNFSSDIDIIVLFDAATETVAGDAEPRSFFVRLTKDLVKLLQEHTGEGFAYRTDLRLRPDPAATNVAISTDAAAQYYESFGQNWERAAMIKARPIAGDIPAGEAFLAEMRPFIWRKYLDFAAIADVHSIKRQIQAYRGHADVAVAGHNIKLGRGGIREVEFFVQTQQLIAGGRNPDLRGRRTLEMLAALADEGWIDATARDDLAAAYRVLRAVENRLQMVADQQTQMLPKGEAELDAFAVFAGYGGRDEFTEMILPHLRAVERHYTSLFEHAPDLGFKGGSLSFTGGEDHPSTLETLTEMGFADPKLISRTVRAWHHGRYAATRPAAARERLTELMPALLQAFSESESPDRALLAFDRFLEGLPAGVQLFSLLCANEELLALLADVMGAAPRLARRLSARPRTLEGVLDASFYGPLPDGAAYRSEAEEELRYAQNFEDSLDRARVFGQEQFFRVGVQLLSGTADAAEAGRANADLAAGIIAGLLEATYQEIAAQYGRVAEGQIAVIGMGRLGSHEMTATSDIDIILVYDVKAGATESDGAKPLSVGQYYSRFAQRFISALSAPTAEGRLYEVDMRLRPSGRAGPVATRLSAFAEYHAASSWTWERMALTRARVVAGPARLQKSIEDVIAKTVVAPRDRAELAKDVRNMRERIAAEKGSGDRWNVKLVRGGLLDIEFIAQFLQLAHAADHPEVLSPNTATALRQLAEAGLVGPREAEDLLEALRLYHTVSQFVRLCLGEPADPEKAAPSFQRRLAKAANLPDFSAVAADLEASEARVKSIFDAIVK